MLAGRRLLLGGALAAPFVRPARAARPFTLVTNWYAEPEHGGFFQAQATGLYRDAGLEVVIQPGSPQLNVVQLLLGGEADAVIGFDPQVLIQVARGVPIMTVAAMFQFDQEGLLVHDDITRIEQLRGHTLMIASASQTGFWPWLKLRFGFTDDQARPYNNNVQPFLMDRMVATQAIATAEPCTMRASGVPVRFLPFHDAGYPTYSCTIVMRRDVAERDPGRIRAFVEASARGYRDYLGGDPGPANRLILSQNPVLNQGQIDCAVGVMRATSVITGGDAAHGGIGVMTAARWQATAEFLTHYRLLPQGVDWRRAFSLDYLPSPPVVM